MKTIAIYTAFGSSEREAMRKAVELSEHTDEPVKVEIKCTQFSTETYARCTMTFETDSTTVEEG